MTEAIQLRTYAQIQKYNFFRQPDWRWERVLSLVDREPTPGRCSRRDDDYVRKARSFVLRWRQASTETDRDRLMFENPGLHFAYQFNLRLVDDPEAAMYVQARLLARQTPEHIGNVMGVLPDAVRWYSLLFFDVLDRLDQRDWITKQILVPAMMRNNGTRPALSPGTEADSEAAMVLPSRDSTIARPFLDGSLKLFAYFGGTHLVDVLIGGLEAGKPLTSPDDLKNWWDSTWSGAIRRRSAQASVQFEINKYNVLELFAVHTRIIEIERSEDSADQARTVTEKHIKAMVDEIPWAVGEAGAKVYSRTVVGRFDVMASELRDDELLKLASGQTADTLKDYPAALPPPRREKKSEIMEAAQAEI